MPKIRRFKLSDLKEIMGIEKTLSLSPGQRLILKNLTKSTHMIFWWLSFLENQQVTF
jgi:hypothetical protein